MNLALAFKVGKIQALWFSKLVCCVTTLPPAFQDQGSGYRPFSFISYAVLQRLRAFL